MRLVAMVLFGALGAGCNCGHSKPGGAGGGHDGGTGGGSGFATGGGTAAGGGGGDVGCGLVTCATAHATCGPIGDGCGGTLDCGSCTAPQTCGGGGVPSQCGGNGGCTPRTCVASGANCGPFSDGCGQLLDCGTCSNGETCGGGGIANRCGMSGTSVVDGGCVPRTCQSASAGCGALGDGCGALIASCGGCDAGTVCGGGGVPNQCGTTFSCSPRTCAQANANCGTLGDGCGGTISCGACTGSNTCGGGGVANQCGAPAACVPLSCAQLNANCGQQGDGCGGLTPSCGSCDGGDICGGAGIPNVCGDKVPDAGQCVNLCLQQAACDAGTTTLTGVVLAPTNPDAGYGNPDPIPNALVYVPNAPVEGFDAGVSCQQCSASASGKPLVTTYSDIDGGFVLSNVPCGTNIPVVIQLGKWRRQITVPSVACCANTALSAEQTRLPRNKAEGDIPLIAVVTGSADPIECVLPKLGIDRAEFTNPGGDGRVRFYRDNGARLDAGTPGAAQLYNDAGTMMQYDLLILDCVGSEVAKTAAQRTRLGDYTAAGGRVFSSHFGYVWLSDTLGTPGNYSTQSTPFPGVANWAPQQPDPAPQTGLAASVDQSFPKGQTFAQWLFNIGASAPLGSIAIDATRYDFTSVINPPAQQWVYRPTNIPVEFTFNTPVTAPASQQCGRVLFSDFHVNTGGSGGGTFPTECGTPAPLTPQEKVLEYLLFDLSSCIAPDNGPATCTPLTCTQQGYTCGQQSDGCGGVLSCGSCATGQVCGGGGQNGVCRPLCVPQTCGGLGFNCGLQGDGCGNVIDCGSCAPPQTCGGGGTAGQCGQPSCAPKTCAQLGYDCGLQGDGCGGQVDCGSCPTGQLCGAGGPGLCAPVGCVPTTCAQQNLSCGPAGDGCGNIIQCGTCNPPDTCGGGGVNGQCGHGCTPTTCMAAGANCGAIADGCGGTIDCGGCPNPLTCGGGGLPNVCGTVP